MNDAQTPGIAHPKEPRASVLKTAYRSAKTILRRRGWWESLEAWVPPLDLRTVTDDPLEAYYQSKGGRFIIDVPLSRCTAFGVTAFPGDSVERNPFVATLAAYEAGTCRSYADSPMRRFFESWQPATLAEAVGVPVEEASPPLLEPPTAAPPFPWARQGLGVDRQVRLGLKQFRAAQRQAGVDDADVDGIIFYGPVTPAFGETTFARLTAVYDSLRANGYQPHKHVGGYLVARLLARDGDYRVLIRSGKHRIAALGALRYEQITVQLAGRYQPAVVHREDVASWPNVRSGLYTRDQALSIFDRVFEGRQPPGCPYGAEEPQRVV